MRSLLVFLIIGLAAPAARSVRAESPQDSDRDGLSDVLERETGTDPLRADTDKDGVVDGVEDADADGVRDPGETDPRRAGLFPGGSPYIPEPLTFDLVRALGARRGELEVNTLVVVDVDRALTLWAPEVEWAFADGYAVELELPFVDRELEALKMALQGTLPSHAPSFVHGWQTFAEVGLDQGHVGTVLLYIVGHRFSSKGSYLAMVGPAMGFARGERATAAAQINASVFVDVREWQTWGLETNTTVAGRGDWVVRVFPQVHLQVNQRFRVQLSVGAEARPSGPSALVALRFILE